MSWRFPHNSPAATDPASRVSLLNDHEFPASEPPVRHGLRVRAPARFAGGPRLLVVGSPGAQVHAHADAQLGKSGVVQRRVLGFRSTNCISGRDGRTPSVFRTK
jgi:hypothetical protein